MKFHDREWMVYKVLRQDKVQTDAEPSHPKYPSQDYLALTWGNLARALFFGKRVRYQVLPDEEVTRMMDYTYLGPKGSRSLGFNAPPWIEDVRGKVVEQTFYYSRWGKITKKNSN